MPLDEGYLWMGEFEEQPRQVAKTNICCICQRLNWPQLLVRLFAV